MKTNTKWTKMCRIWMKWNPEIDEAEVEEDVEPPLIEYDFTRRFGECLSNLANVKRITCSISTTTTRFGAMGRGGLGSERSMVSGSTTKNLLHRCIVTKRWEKR